MVHDNTRWILLINLASHLCVPEIGILSGEFNDRHSCFYIFGYFFAIGCSQKNNRSFFY